MKCIFCYVGVDQREDSAIPEKRNRRWTSGAKEEVATMARPSFLCVLALLAAAGASAARSTAESRLVLRSERHHLATTSLHRTLVGKENDEEGDGRGRVRTVKLVTQFISGSTTFVCGFIPGAGVVAVAVDGTCYLVNTAAVAASSAIKGDPIAVALKKAGAEFTASAAKMAATATGAKLIPGFGILYGAAQIGDVALELKHVHKTGKFRSKKVHKLTLTELIQDFLSAKWLDEQVGRKVSQEVKFGAMNHIMNHAMGPGH